MAMRIASASRFPEMNMTANSPISIPENAGTGNHGIVPMLSDDDREELRQNLYEYATSKLKMDAALAIDYAAVFSAQH